MINSMPNTILFPHGYAPWLSQMLVLIALATGFTGNIVAQTDWFKGNLHTHSLWSDGDEYPEMIAEWYRTNGYHFLAISDHDAHNYHAYDSNKSNPGRGWVMVRAARLDAPSIIDTMEKGDFYASSGVRLFDVRRDRKRLGLIIEPEPGVTYRTQFIGTRIGYDPSSMPVIGTNGQPLAVTRIYSSDIGQVFAEVAGTTPSYTLKGNELYVRAKVISSKPKSNPYAKGEVDVAWSQPLVGASKRKSHVGC